MQSAFFETHGGPEVMRYTADGSEPEPGAGEVLVRQHAAGLNYVDTLVRRGYPGLTVPLPHSPGGDIAGEVAAVGAGVEGWQAGDRVLVYPLIHCSNCALCQQGDYNLCLNWQFIGMHRNGGYQELLAVPQQNLIHLPDSVSFTEAAALPVAGLTAMHGLATVGKLEAGQTFFIWGGAGGLGSIAIQLAKNIGARVAATCSSEEKRGIIRNLGADLVINRKAEDVAQAVREFAPDGVDLILDYCGTETFPVSFDLLKKGGTLMLCGIITGREATISLHMTYLRHLSIRGLYMGTKPELEKLVGLVASGTVKPVVGETLHIRQAAEGHRRLEAGEVVGKLVFTFS
jgi:NADPH:quinone reductase-like Zn-dependent oxidoreductase